MNFKGHYAYVSGWGGITVFISPSVLMSPAALSADLEPLQALGRLLEDLEFVDFSPAGAFHAPPHHSFDRLGLSLEGGFDRPVGTVPDPTRDAAGASYVRSRVAESDALHEPAKEHATSDHIGGVRATVSPTVAAVLIVVG